MVCSLCQGRGHNRRTCLRNVTGLNAVPPINNPPIRGTTFNLNVRNKWKKAIQSILFLKKFVTAATCVGTTAGRCCNKKPAPAGQQQQQPGPATPSPGGAQPAATATPAAGRGRGRGHR